MFSKIRTMKSIENYSANINRLKQVIDNADAVLIGAGAGLSTSAGYTYDGVRFQKYFADFNRKYGISDTYSGGFYPYETLEEYWAWWARHIYFNRYDQPQNDVYQMLLQLIQDKDYFILTTNVDHLFQINHFDKKRLFYTQGDYGLWQCSKACHRKTYNNEAAVRKMLAEQQDMKIPSELIPYCPVCGAPMTMNLRCDNSFVQDDGWYQANKQYKDFVRRYKDSNLLLFELGVGNNTPVIIKYSFWNMTAQNRRAIYACINYGEALVPREIEKQAICINADISKILAVLR